MRTPERHRSIVVRGGRIIDPTAQRDEVADLAIVDGRIIESPSHRAHVVHAEGQIACPGLWDIHVHLREPGQSHKETMETGTAAAAAGGFTLVACMPNTQPPLDEPERIRWVLDRARQVGHCRVAPVAAITRGREGRDLTDFAVLKESGAVAFSDDGIGVEDDTVMRRAFEAAAKLDAVLIQHCEYRYISAGGVMHLGDVSRRLGLPGLDPRSEEAMIERDIDLCRRTGGRYHVAHISTARAVALVCAAKKEGLPVTAEVCAHHLLLTDQACESLDPNTKMHPPLRPQVDVDACRAGLLDGTIDCIVTDHAPHTVEEKSVGFVKAPPGIVGLETAWGIAAEALVATGLATWPQVIQWFTAAPGRVLQMPRQTIEPGARAELTILDPERVWTVDPDAFLSKARNAPFMGKRLTGMPLATILGDTIFHRPLQSGLGHQSK